LLLEFQALDERLWPRVRTAIGRLLRDQFVHTDDHGSRSILETLHSAKVRTFLESYFDAAGYRIIFNQIEGWAGLLPDLETNSAPRMRIDERCCCSCCAGSGRKRFRPATCRRGPAC
jgi:hypothetical protein